MEIATISIYNAEGARLTSTQFQYRVRASLLDGDKIESQDEYPILTNLIAENQEVQNAEGIRIENENIRIANETDRERDFDAKINEVDGLMSGGLARLCWQIRRLADICNSK